MAIPTVPLRHGRPKLSLIMTADRHAKGRHEPVAQRPRRAVRVARQKEDALSAGARRDIRVVNAGIGHHKTEAMLDDQQSRAMPHHPFGFAQHDFDKTGVFVDFGGERHRPRRRLHRCHFDIAAFGLRDDLLRDNQDIAFCRRQPICSKCRDRDGRQIVTGLDQLDPGQRP